MKRIAVLISSYNFQKRLNWMLSSLNNQVGIELVIYVAVNNGESGSKSSLDIVDFFQCNTSNNVLCYWQIVSYDTFNSRGLTRTLQLRKIQDFHSFDYFLFADCDHIYEHDFLKELIDKADENISEKALFSVARYSTKKVEVVNQLVDNFHYPCVIKNPVTKYRRAVKNNNIYKTSNPGAGNCQLVHRDTISDKIYVEDKTDGGIINGSSKFPSDKVFRKRINNHIKLSINSKQYHLQHYRVDADGISSDTQR